MNPNSLTVIPTAIETAVKPKPTRAEIIDAMTHLRVVQLTKQREAARAHANELEKKVKKAIIAAASKSNLEVSQWYVYGNGAGLRSSLSLAVVPPSLLALAKEAESANQACRITTEFKEVRKEVQRDFAGTMDRSERVEAILKDPEAVKALNGALAKLY